MGCVPGTGRGDLHRAIAVVADPDSLHGDFAEGGLEGKGACAPALDAAAALAVAPLEDQFLVGLLDEGAEESALDFEAGLMDEGLDLVGEMLVLVGHRQGHLQRQVERKCLSLAVDRAEGDGSLKVVGITHGESPYWNYGGSSCVFSPIRMSQSLPQGQITRAPLFLILCNLLRIAHQLASA